MEEAFNNIPGLILFGDYKQKLSNVKKLISKILSLILLVLYFLLSDESIKINDKPVITTIIVLITYLIISIIKMYINQSSKSILNFIVILILLSLSLLEEKKISSSVSIIILFCLYILLESNINYKNSDYECEKKNNNQCKLKDIYTNPIINYVTVFIIIILLIHKDNKNNLKLIIVLLVLNLLLPISNLAYVKDVKCVPQYNIETNEETKNKIKVFTHCQKINENNKLVQLKKWSILLGFPLLLVGIFIIYNHFIIHTNISNLLQILISVLFIGIIIFYIIFDKVGLNNKIYEKEDKNDVNSKNEFNLMVNKYMYLIIFSILIAIIININPEWKENKKDGKYLIFITILLSLLFTINYNLTFIIISSIVGVILYLLILISKYMGFNLLEKLI